MYVKQQNMHIFNLIQFPLSYMQKSRVTEESVRSEMICKIILSIFVTLIFV